VRSKATTAAAETRAKAAQEVAKLRAEAAKTGKPDKRIALAEYARDIGMDQDKVDAIILHGKLPSLTDVRLSIMRADRNGELSEEQVEQRARKYYGDMSGAAMGKAAGAPAAANNDPLGIRKK
jgi:hypothetical protein